MPFFALHSTAGARVDPARFGALQAMLPRRQISNTLATAAAPGIRLCPDHGPNAHPHIKIDHCLRKIPIKDPGFVPMSIGCSGHRPSQSIDYPVKVSQIWRRDDRAPRS
jgi:hypothetical protein